MNKLEWTLIFQEAWSSFTSLMYKILFLEYNIWICLFFVAMLLVFFLQGKSKKHLKDSKLSIMWFCIGFFWCWAIFYIAPYKSTRYIAPAMFLVLLFFPVILSALDYKKQLFFIVSLSLLLLFITYNDEKIYWDKDPIDENYLQHLETPAIIAGSNYWCQAILIPYYTDDRPIELTFSPEDMLDKVQKYDNLYLFVIADMLDKYPIPEDYEVEHSFAIRSYYNVYQLRKK